MPDRSATQFEGFHTFQNDEGDSYGSFNVYWLDEAPQYGDHDDEILSEGWYWIAQFLGCMPDSPDPTGPFETSEEAHDDAQSI